MKNISIVYLIEQIFDDNGGKTISIADEISRSEMDQLINTQWFSSLYTFITQARDIAIQNGKDFQDYILPSNIAKLRQKPIEVYQLILNANKLVLSYATSLKTYIDIQERILKKHEKIKELEQFKELCSHFYDTSIEYRFWMNFRNYVVHCEFPYHGFAESYKEGYKLICRKEHLLEFTNWKHSKKDIENMDKVIDLPSMVIEMSSIIMSLYMSFFVYFAEDIFKALSAFQSFCKKYNVNQPAFLISNEKITKGNFEIMVKNSQLCPLPTDTIIKAFNVLKQNPNVNISYINHNNNNCK
ncbi:hypothetical protein RBG61_07430 [Paludicola sp. MB14-C6]|uniref:hypothetical protein n=1 Tax=Paludihabitans sp. MB14-C6 TaxID=3070656 RepID=UPI0027DC4376|nr:hypothetical protein [Paludicola sp. MB14-C6]WMJ21835.1 hypothetical protein RBG61_07430 [Paludicola sp. MB14-C6]